MAHEIEIGTQYMPIPETYSRRKLNALYREIPLKDTVSRVLRKYFNAMANLYGVIPLKKAYEIISGQNPRLVSEDEFIAFSEIARHECEDYYILGLDEIYTDGKAGSLWDREIIDVTLFGDDIDPYHETLRGQRGKPYYVPAKKELLCYDNPFFCEDTPETQSLKLFLSNCFSLSEDKLEAIFIDILYGTRCKNAGLQEVLNRLHELGLDFSREADAHKFVELYQKFHNSTRMQCNRGHTPDELFNMQPHEERIPKSLSFGPNIRKAIAEGNMNTDELRKGILSLELPNEELRMSLLKELSDAESARPKEPKKKVGRNDPCPCGSGKKYKKCCGR